MAEHPVVELQGMKMFPLLLPVLSHFVNKGEQGEQEKIKCRSKYPAEGNVQFKIRRGGLDTSLLPCERMFHIGWKEKK